MAIWVQFWQIGMVAKRGTKPEVIEACGDRAVVRLDARARESWQVETARRECAARGYVGFTLLKGETLCRTQTIRKFEAVTPKPA